MCRDERLGPAGVVRGWVHRRWAALDGCSAPQRPATALQTRQASPAGGKVEPVADLPEELRRLAVALEGVAGRERRLLVTWTTGGRGFVQQALNLALSIRRHVPQLESSFAAVALDEGARGELEGYGFQVVLHPVPQGELPDAIWKFRWQLLLAALHSGLEIAAVDSDVVVFKDPFAHVGRDAELEIATEHLWPERHLWEPWVRPEDDLSTGFIYARPSGRLATFLSAFLDENSEEALVGGTLRDPFDQRVFSKFVRARAAACQPCIEGVYGDSSFSLSGGSSSSSAAAREAPLRIRVLDSVKVVANGVNFFWRRAHLLTPQDGLPALVHANGVGPKEYFLRDRGLWYLNDLAERFGRSPRFLRYRHPRGLALGEDFAQLAAGLEAARSLGRRLVLPDTMNCRNCPAYGPYGLADSLPGGPESCTPDYFAYMFRLMHVHGQDVVEAGIVRDEAFADLWGPTAELPTGAGAAAKAARGASRQDAILSFSGDVRELRDALLASGKPPPAPGLPPAAARANCSWHEWPHRFMACRDDAFVGARGGAQPCSPSEGQAGCGLEGLTCCTSHHGRADRLQYYTGAAWDLPCNCGLDVCEEASAVAVGTRCCRRRVTDGDAAEGALCTWSGDAYPDGAPATNPDKDLPFYSSTVLARFESGELSAEELWRQCERHRRVYFLVREPLEGLAEADCNMLVGGFLVSRQAWDRARTWWRFSLERRRGPESISVSLETGQPDGFLLELPKLRHDAEQLEYLVGRGLEAKIKGLRGHAASLARLRDAHARLAAGSRDRSEVAEALTGARAVYNRALHVPEGTGTAGLAFQPDSAFGGSAALLGALSSGGFAAHRQLLAASHAQDLASLLRESTIWYLSRRGGLAVEAQLRDGLHAAAVTQLGAALRELLAAGGLASASLGLADVRARSYGVGGDLRSVGPECLDAEIAVLVAVGGGGATLRAYHGEAPPMEQACAPPASWDEEATRRKKLAAAESRQMRIDVGGAAAWNASSSWFELEADPGPSSFEERHLFLLFLFGRSPGLRFRSGRRARGFLHEHDVSWFKYATA